MQLIRKRKQGREQQRKESKRKEETTKENNKHIWISKVKVGKLVRDQQIRLNVNYKTKINKSDDLMKYTKEGCEEIIGKSSEAVLSKGEMNSNAKH
eukprot:10505260-Ditylum_brightwellii.AAC.1